MSALNTAMNVIGTVATLKSLFGSTAGGPGGRMTSFMSEIGKAGVARTNLFDVTITAPQILVGNPTAPKISLYAEGAAVPGRSITTQEVFRYGYGPSEKVPYSMQFNDVTLQFIGDGQGEIYKFFYNWMQGIVRGDYDVRGAKLDRNAKGAYEVEFKENYATNIAIVQYNEQGQIVLETTLFDAFPIQVPDVSLNWSDGSMMQFSVTFAYLQSRLETADKPVNVSPNGFGGLSTLQKLVKIGTAVQALSSLKRPSGVQDALSSLGTIKTVAGGFR